ncbi:bifunctional 5,10-methylenetetrahydrofolate dehydrogenase/5,10-methenyltetrahydrofolate cyclohydrolase [symbiont of Argiope bruennichi]|uniref:tetrahydrofolate dehydrogenase/cyclohydrolase catalytic domain-containing protein n=1 Tax=symbiont of Argiope bruennichi TaxID=2810479 RepID=UPI003DA55FDF
MIETKILDGKKLSFIFEKKILKITNLLPKKPKLTIFLTTDNFSSRKYVDIKIKKAKHLNFLVELIYLPECKNELFFKLLDEKNNDPNIDGILVQFPTNNLDEKEILSKISSKKDVDSITPANIGLIFQDNYDLLNPVVSAVNSLISFYKISLKGKYCVLIGSSNIVGKPLISWLVNQKVTLTVCNEFTNNLENILKAADIIITAVGKPNFIGENLVKNNCIIIDIGINKLNNCLVGDVHADEKLWNKVSYLTPVPGGIGPLTVIFLFYNLLFLYLKNYNLLDKYQKFLDEFKNI